MRKQIKINTHFKWKQSYLGEEIDSTGYASIEIDESKIIGSDSFTSYQVNNFKRLGFILKKVNHSIWFGYGLFHNNTVESLWSQIKTYTHNFTGISIENLNKEFNNDETQIQEYLDGWITYALLLREFNTDD